MIEPRHYLYGFKTYSGGTHWQLNTAPYNGQREPDYVETLTTVADVLKATVMDIQDGCLRVTQGKTGAKLRIALEGRLGALVMALKPPRSAQTVVCTHLIRNEDEQPLTYSAMTQRFSKARDLAMKAAVADEQSALAVSLKGFQFRDLRAKAASDPEDLARAQELLGHADRSMTQDYVRARIGDRVRPVK